MLPNEILQEIFKFALPDAPDSSTRIPRDVRAKDVLSLAPHSLLRVCKRWRDNCKTLPSLWTVLHIPDVPTDREARALYATWFITLLLRSRDEPLSIFLYIDSSKIIDTHSDQYRILEVILSEAPRLRDLYFSLGDETRLDIRLPWVPALRKLRTFNLSDSGARTILKPILYRALKTSQNLRHLTMDLTPGLLSKMPWGSVTHIVFSSIAWNVDAVKFMEGLRAATRLESLTIKNCQMEWLAETMDNFSLPSLTYLDIHTNLYNVLFFDIFATIETPRLEVLKLHSDRFLDTSVRRPGEPIDEDDEDEIWTYSKNDCCSAFHDFIKICATTLRSLQLTGKLSEILLLRILRILPNLTELSLPSSAYTVRVIRHLTLLINPAGELYSGPHPQNLRLVDIRVQGYPCTPQTFHYNLFTNMMESRMWLNGPAMGSGRFAQLENVRWTTNVRVYWRMNYREQYYKYMTTLHGNVDYGGHHKYSLDSLAKQRI